MLIAGPTASGKSALALALARALDGTVINADSMQLYADLRILTARPSLADEAAVPHRLYGVQDAAHPCSAAQWRNLALAQIESAWAAGRLPIVVGGTSLYLETLADGIAAVPPIPADVRSAVRAMALAELRAALEQEDPPMAARLHRQDRQRQSRALEVVRASGKSLTYWQRQTSGGLVRHPSLGTLIRLRLVPERTHLYAACDARLAAMVTQGALEEVAALAARGLPASLPLMKALGMRELAAHLAGDEPLQSALTRAQQSTRHYVKRQLTWLRNRLHDWDPIGAHEKDKIIDQAFIKLRNSGLTTQS